MDWISATCKSVCEAKAKLQSVSRKQIHTDDGLVGRSGSFLHLYFERRRNIRSKIED